MKKTYVNSTTETNIRIMKSFYAIILLLIIVGCKTDKLQEQAAIASFITPGPEILSTVAVDTYSTWTHDDYELKLEMNELENDIYDLQISMQLNGNSHYVSPNATRDFKGKFSVTYNEPDKLKVLSELEETPRSVEEYDPHPFVRGKVNWVRENTKYNQKMKATVEKDFLVEGLIQFTIEPRCTLEQIPFFIKYEGGRMWVEIKRC